MKALIGAFNQEKALVGAFFVIVKLLRLLVCSTSRYPAHKDSQVPRVAPAPVHSGAVVWCGIVVVLCPWPACVTVRGWAAACVDTRHP